MRGKQLYRNFLHKWAEVAELPPQTVGPLTPVYKKTVPLLKVAPWRILIPLSLVAAAVIALSPRWTAVQLVSLLQQGF